MKDLWYRYKFGGTFTKAELEYLAEWEKQVEEAMKHDQANN